MPVARTVGPTVRVPAPPGQPRVTAARAAERE